MGQWRFNAGRHRALEKELTRITEVLKHSYDPEKIIVFGSFVRGETRKWSDLDMAIVKKTDRRFLDRLKDVAHLVGPGLACDFLVYTPQEFSEMARDNYFVRDEIIKKGKVLYDKSATQ